MSMARAALSGVLSQARGRVGSEVLVKTRSGWAIKSRPRYRQFPHPETAAARERLKEAAEAWASLSMEQLEAWRRYARKIERRSAVGGGVYSPSAYNAFVGLATRFLQANPIDTPSVPLWPPTFDWPGENVTLSAQASEEGAILTASAANRLGVVTEVLIQRLANIRRSPKPFYKSAAVHRFESGSLEFELLLNPGAYALAYRFIQASDGQSVGLTALGVIEVP
jgi:hypothetical protein